jgi:hypothetical protein
MNRNLLKEFATIVCLFEVTLPPYVSFRLSYQCSGSMTFWSGSDPDPDRRSVPLTNGSGSGSWIRILLFSSLTFKMPTKN